MPCCNLLRGCFIYTSLLNITTQPAFALCFAQNTPVGARQATPYRRLGFVGDALSITVRRGGLRPASRDHADQTFGTHYNTSLTLRETALPNLTTPPFNPFFTHPSPALFYRLTILLALALYSDIPHLPDTYDYMIPCNIV